MIVNARFPNLSTGLVGISDAVLQDHLELYQREANELEMLRADEAAAPWVPPSGLSPLATKEILAARVGDLRLGAITGPLADAIDEVEGELEDKGITWRPLWYVGDSDFWTTDRANSINVPWFLANESLWEIVNGNYLRYAREDVVRILRHETGHALAYAFRLYQHPLWRATFGDFDAPYVDAFVPDPGRAAEFVSNIQRNGSAPLEHYPQKHPDEDWAETFAVWLDEGSRWRDEYADRPRALAKLAVVDQMIATDGLAYGEAPNKSVGKRVSYTMLDLTVGGFIGVRGTPDATGAQRRRASTLVSATTLHRLYFEALSRGAGQAGIGPLLATQATKDFGDVSAWMRDLRALARATDGWALTVWDADRGRIANAMVDSYDCGVPPDCRVLIAIDLHDHAYAGDVGIRKDVYLAAFFRNLDWATVELRLVAAGAAPASMPVVVVPGPAPAQ